LVLAILLFLFFNKGSNATQTEMQPPVNNTPLDSSAIPAMDTKAVALDSTIVDSTK
jgi:hypothetical protein